MSGIPTLTIAELEQRGEAALQTGPFGTQLKASEYTSEGTPVINVRNIGFGDLRKDDLEYLPESKTAKLWQHHLRAGDIVFGRKGAVERHALIDADSDGWIQGSDCLRLRLTSKTVSEKYLSYYLRTAAHQDWMQALCSFGATMSSLNQDILRRLTFPAPSLVTQKKIAAILSAYDDLIANNQRRITLLEHMAEDIYREWFVRLRFPGHKQATVEMGVPHGWVLQSLGDIVELCYGKALKDNDRIPGAFNVYGSSGVVGTHNVALVEGPGLVIGRKGNVGSVFWSDAPFFPIDTAYFVRSNVSLYYLSFLLRSMNFINNDAAVPGLNRQQAYANKILFPPVALISRFDAMVKPCFDMKQVIAAQVECLKATRDALLPRLISGKLAVDGLEIRFPPGIATAK